MSNDDEESRPPMDLPPGWITLTPEELLTRVQRQQHPITQADEEEIIARMEGHLALLLGLTSPIERAIWMYIVSVATQMEALAVTALWFDAGKPETFATYERRVTLNQAAGKIRDRRVLRAETVATLKALADLRNSLVHRQALAGVQSQQVSAPGAEYKGRPIFPVSEVVDQLVNDVQRVIDDFSQYVLHFTHAERQGLDPRCARTGPLDD